MICAYFLQKAERYSDSKFTSHFYSSLGSYHHVMLSHNNVDSFDANLLFHYMFMIMHV